MAPQPEPAPSQRTHAPIQPTPASNQPEAAPAQATPSEPEQLASTPSDLQLANPLPPGPGVCPTCRLFTDPAQPFCHSCATQPNHLDAVAPITYAPRGGPAYATLRAYKRARLLQQGTCAVVRISGLLWRFLESHERCLAAAAGAPHFDLVTTVPSGDPGRDEQRANLRATAAWCGPIADRHRRLLRPTGNGAWGRTFDPHRYRATEPLTSASILLIDDLWVTGGHAQSAAHALREAGATTVALVVVGRYFRPNWPAGDGTNCADRLAAIQTSFDWNTCAAENSPAEAGGEARRKAAA